MSSTTLINLPEESLCCIAQFLTPPDILQFVSIHPTYIPLLCHSKQFWSYLNQVHYSKSNTDNYSNNNGTEDWANEKNEYLLKSYCNTISHVRWYSVDTSPQPRPFVQSGQNLSYEEPLAREGHVSCIIGNYLVLTGGFTDDDDIYVKHLNSFNDGTTWMRIPLDRQCHQNPQLVKNWVYGATLTPFSNTSAIMFGGFKSGGYSNETSQVAVLHLEESDCNPLLSTNMPPPVIKVWWEIVECNVYCEDACASALSGAHDRNESFLRIAGRAYHAATLLFDRYLLIMGGMQSRGSILNPILLDCHSWTWYLDGITSSTVTPSIVETSRPVFPSGRHGCSMIADMEANRNRLLLFGGGSGVDLLRSGTDNTEVWELSLKGCQHAGDVISSLPWTWNILHLDQTSSNDSDDNDDDSNDQNKDNEAVRNLNCLSSVERLNLGRCHGCYRVGRDVVVLAFGSGGPTTNSVLCYNLKDDSFFRTIVHPSFIPRARFTFASTFVESKGIIIFHGGYSTRPHSEALSDTILLDLAPDMSMNGRIWLPIDCRAKNHSMTTDSINPMGQISMFGNSLTFFSFFCSQLMGESNEGQREISSRLLSVMDESQQSETVGEIVGLFASGQLMVGEDGSIICHDLDPDSEYLIHSLF
jgi:hypothetical protein